MEDFCSDTTRNEIFPPQHFPSSEYNHNVVEAKGPPTSPSIASLGSPRPVNGNFLYRCLTLLAIKILKRIRPRSGNVLMLTDRLCVKYGPRVHLSEASTMHFISQHTSIPVPKVLCLFTHSGWTYIVMERIKGDMIGSGWVKRSEVSKAKLLSQLARKVREMRDLQPPEGMGIASVDGVSLFDCRIPGPSLRFGPFDTIQDFHRHLRMSIELDSRLDPEIQELIKQQSKSWPLVFTHGDLSSLNILFAEMISLVLLIGKLLVGIHHIGNTLLPTKSTHKTLFGSMRSTNSSNQCLKSWRWNGSVKDILEIFK